MKISELTIKKLLDTYASTSAAVGVNSSEARAIRREINRRLLILGASDE